MRDPLKLVDLVAFWILLWIINFVEADVSDEYEFICQIAAE
jgi:hypothetical protein